VEQRTTDALGFGTTVAEEASPSGVSDQEIIEDIDAIPIPKKFVDDVSNRIKIGKLAAANRLPLCVSPDTRVEEAITLMLQNDYSQLPVTTTIRDVKGTFSWKALGSRLALGKKCERVPVAAGTTITDRPRSRVGQWHVSGFE
jgi:CBS domain